MSLCTLTRIYGVVQQRGRLTKQSVEPMGTQCPCYKEFWGSHRYCEMLMSFQRTKRGEIPTGSLTTFEMTLRIKPENQLDISPARLRMQRWGAFEINVAPQARFLVCGLSLPACFDKLLRIFIQSEVL